MYQSNLVHTLFDHIDGFVQNEAVIMRGFNDDNLAELFAMLSEHYGQLADQYSPDDTEAADPYADQAYCKHCGTELAYQATEVTPQAEDAKRNHGGNRPSAIYKPGLTIDGNKWCALYGDNLQDGVAGFGDSPAEAMLDFDANWQLRLEQKEELPKMNTKGINNPAIDYGKQPENAMNAKGTD